MYFVGFIYYTCLYCRLQNTESSKKYSPKYNPSLTDHIGKILFIINKIEGILPLYVNISIKYILIYTVDT
jgi:hypothetical protein